MKYAEVKAAALNAGLNDAQVQNAALWLTRDDMAPTMEAAEKYFAAVLKPKARKAKPTDGLRLLTTPEEKFGA